MLLIGLITRRTPLKALIASTLPTGRRTEGPTNPRFYQTTISLAALFGSTNKALTALNFTQPGDANSTAIYAVSGLLGGSNSFKLATVTNEPATGVLPNSATLNGAVVSNGGYIPNITIYYGSSDGNTNASAWASSVNIGLQNGAFSQTVGNLTPGVAYYVSVEASNAAGISWGAPATIYHARETHCGHSDYFACQSGGHWDNGDVHGFRFGRVPVPLSVATNGANISGATNSSLVLSNATVAMSGSYDVVVTNAFGAVTSAPVVLTVTTQLPAVTFNNGTNWTINQTGTGSGNITGSTFNGTDGGGGEAVTAWYNSPVEINGFVASFTYQDVGGSPGANADGASFDIQEALTYIGADGRAGRQWHEPQRELGA